MTQEMTSNKSSKGLWFYSLQIIRILVGVLFIFSGLIKANDPSGLAYKMQEYFEVWHMTFFSPFALTLSIVMIAFEILAGVALLLGYFYKTFSFLLFLLMIFFTYLTAYAVFSGKIKECGCFGDCIPLQAMQSFIKDLILLVLAFILVLGRKHIKPLFKPTINTFLMLIALAATGFIQWYALKHLPFVDCLPYKVGNNLWQEMQTPEGGIPDVYETTYELKNTTSGETKTMSDQEYLDSGIWEDTTWTIVGDPVQKLIKKGTNNTPAIEDFHIFSFDGEDFTEYLLNEPGYNFLLFVKDVQTASLQNMEHIQHILEQSLKGNMGFYILSASSQEATEEFVKANKLEAATVYSIDATACKTALRTNPGLMLIKAGDVKGKWSYKDYPSSINWKNDKELELK